MNLKETVETRRAIHEYTDESIDDETWSTLFERVKYTPTGYNLQPQEFLVLEDEADQQKLRSCAYDQEQVTDAAAAVVVLGNTDPSAHAVRIFNDWLEKDHIPSEDVRDQLLETVNGWEERSRTENRIWTVRNTSLAAMTLIYAAWDLGIASCPMEGFDGDAVKETFDIDDGYEPVMVITLGYATDEALEQSKPRKFRQPPEEIAHFGEFEPYGE